MALPLIQGEFSLVTEPEFRFSEKGTSWASCRIVANDRKRDPQGQWVDGDPCFLDLTVFGKYAEHMVEADLQKGDRILVTGRLQMRQSEKDGVTRNFFGILAETVGRSYVFSTGPKKESAPSSGSEEWGPAPF